MTGSYESSPTSPLNLLLDVPPHPHPVLVLEPFQITGAFEYEGAYVLPRTSKDEVFGPELPITYLNTVNMREGTRSSTLGKLQDCLKLTGLRTMALMDRWSSGEGKHLGGELLGEPVSLINSL